MDELIIEMKKTILLEMNLVKNLVQVLPSDVRFFEREATLKTILVEVFSS